MVRLTLNGPATVGGSVLVFRSRADSAVLVLDGGKLSVAGNLRTWSDGANVILNGERLDVGSLTVDVGSVITMQNPADTLIVNGSAMFKGATSDGMLTDGVTIFRGDFTQSSVSSPTSFSASGAHTAEFAGTGAQTIRFATPDPTLGSHFANVRFLNASASGVTLARPVFANGQLLAPVGGPTFLVSGSGSTTSMVVRGVDASNLIFDDVPLTVLSGAPATAFDGITWQGFTDLSLTHVTIDRPDVLPTFNNWTFQTSPVPTPGHYVSVNNPGSVTVNSPNVGTARICYLGAAGQIVWGGQSVTTCQ